MSHYEPHKCEVCGTCNCDCEDCHSRLTGMCWCPDCPCDPDPHNKGWYFCSPTEHSAAHDWCTM